MSKMCLLNMRKVQISHSQSMKNVHKFKAFNAVFNPIFGFQAKIKLYFLWKNWEIELLSSKISHFNSPVRKRSVNSKN